MNAEPALREAYLFLSSQCYVLCLCVVCLPQYRNEFQTFNVLFHMFSVGHKLSFLMLMTDNVTAIKKMSSCRRHIGLGKMLQRINTLFITAINTNI